MREKRQRRVPFRKRKCHFCEGKIEPSFKEMETLRRFVSDRGKIIPCTRSGVCAKHQRRLAREVKRARFLALLPFITKV
jgi:small subunit ribosomal protein S18